MTEPMSMSPSHQEPATDNSNCNSSTNSKKNGFTQCGFLKNLGPFVGALPGGYAMQKPAHISLLSSLQN